MEKNWRSPAKRVRAPILRPWRWTPRVVSVFGSIRMVSLRSWGGAGRHRLRPVGSAAARRPQACSGGARARRLRRGERDRGGRGPGRGRGRERDRAACRSGQRHGRSRYRRCESGGRPTSWPSSAWLRPFWRRAAGSVPVRWLLCSYVAEIVWYLLFPIYPMLCCGSCLRIYGFAAA